MQTGLQSESYLTAFPLQLSLHEVPMHHCIVPSTLVLEIKKLDKIFTCIISELIIFPGFRHTERVSFVYKSEDKMLEGNSL
jgi:hypothetical protein